jgi:uncharacterized membrane protein SpoIIM required for sporulation
MLESLINPKRVEKGPWKMFFIGLIYGSLSLLLVQWLFSEDPALSKASGMIVVAFSIMFSLPFMYFILKNEESEDEDLEGFFQIFKIHKDAIYAFMFLFLGFLVSFSFLNICLQNSNLLNFQVQTYCQINEQYNVDDCVKKYTLTGKFFEYTGGFSKSARLFSIIENNVFVMIFTLIFSLIFGAGAIFVLIWNASVISAAVGIFSQFQLKDLFSGLTRYMIHGFLEITAYFMTALAGGIFGISLLKNGFKSKKFFRVIENSMILLFIALLIIIIAAVVEVYITPIFFK